MTVPSAYDQIRATVLRWIEDQRVDPADEGAIRRRTQEAIRQWQRSATASERRSLGDVDAVAERVVRSITGFGPLSGLFDAPGIEEIEIEGDLVMYVDSSGRRQTLVAPTTQEENRQAIDRLLAAATQRHLDTRNPMVHARVLGGRARLSAAIPPVADKLSCTIRFHRLRNESLASMVRRGSLTWPAAGFLWAIARTRLSLVISGPPFAGKTSILGAVLAAVPPQRRIRVVEDTRELLDERPTISYLESRARSLAGEGEITLRDLIKFVLKMRPDYIVVGEVLVAELAEVLRAHRSGVRISAALTRAASQTAEPHAARTYRLLVASAEHGADLARGLMDLSRDLHSQRREDLRRLATRQRAATIIPIVVILAPVLLLFVAAPLPSIMFGGLTGR